MMGIVRITAKKITPISNHPIARKFSMIVDDPSRDEELEDEIDCGSITGKGTV